MGMKLARRPRTWFGEEDDIVTAEIYLLRALLQSPVITVPQTTPLADVHRMLVDERVPAVVVVDDERTLLGLITRTDVLRVLLDEPDALAAQAMSRFVVAIAADATIETAAMMATENVGEVVVTGRDGELLGLVSAVDIARHVATRAGYLP
jgi:CBS domain-containing protein